MALPKQTIRQRIGCRKFSGQGALSKFRLFYSDPLCQEAPGSYPEAGVHSCATKVQLQRATAELPTALGYAISLP